MLTTLLRPPTPISELITNPPTTQPAGSQVVDFPYIYVFDGTGLTNATSPTGLNVTITADADFYLRRIFGVPLVASKMQFRQSAGKRYSSDLEIMPMDYATGREIKFEAQSSIRFDLGTVAKKTNGGVGLAYIGFQGAKRMMLNAIPYETPYQFKRLPIQHPFTLSLNWKNNANPNTKMFTYLVQNYDFELHRIEITTSTGGIENGTYKFAILLYDAYGQQTSNLPVMNEWLNERICGTTSNDPGFDVKGNINPVFPVPPLLYPRNSMIRFDIQSLIPAAGSTGTYIVNFCGFDRYPLGA